MKEKEPNNKFRVIIALLIFCLIGVGVAYLIAYKLAVDIPDNNSDNKGTTEVSNTCSYSKLPKPEDLTAEDKTEIIELLSLNNTNLEIDVESLKIDVIDNYTYGVEFEFVKKEGSYHLKDIVWKKDGLWRDYGAGSDFLPEDYENVHSIICESCSDNC